jgi:para-nitrobenzyl esterase
MSTLMSACWVAFATSGIPSCAGAPAWPAYTAERDEQMEFGDVVAVARPARRDAFDLYVKQFMSTAGNGPVQ